MKLNITIAVLALACTALMSVATAHEPAEDAEAGLRVVFAVTPEPATTQQLSQIVFIVRDINAEQGADPLPRLIENAKTIVRQGDREWGPFEVRESRRSPGEYRVQRIFAYPGEYKVTLTYNKTGDQKARQLTWDATLRDRSILVLD